MHGWCARTVGLALLAAGVASASNARAYTIQETSSGIPVHWPTGKIVTVELDPLLISAVAGALPATISAVTAWVQDGVTGPVIEVTIAGAASEPGVDGRNVIYFSPTSGNGATSALARTFVSFDDATGEIFDADIVINASYDFAVLPADSVRAPHAVAILNEANDIPDADAPGPGTTCLSGVHTSCDLGTFDLVHVIAHELGHVRGLRDDPTESTSLMYLMTFPGDASHRAPVQDDLAGVAAIYPQARLLSEGGCSASPVHRSDGPAFAWAPWACAAGFVMRRRGRTRGRREPPVEPASLGSGASHP
jgi:hypothetical protein